MGAEKQHAAGEGRFVRAGIAAGIAVAAMQTAFAFQLDRVPAVRFLAIAALLFFLVASRLGPAVRLQAALLAWTGLPALYAAEWFFARNMVPAGTAALRAGRGFDARSPAEAIGELRRQGIEAYPAFPPRAYYEASHGPLRIGGREVLSLAGISNATTLYCNEGGTYATYRSDERGFNNPPGAWGRRPVEIALVGDSYSQGACVAQDRNLAGVLSRSYPGTLNLGMGGNGPLLELATLKEHLPELKPRIVLWQYFENDPEDLRGESSIPLLRRYLEKDFRQGLAALQPDIDREGRATAAALERTARKWPGWLAAAGITRARTPLWLQDLITGQDHSRVSRAIRLHGWNALAGRFLPAAGSIRAAAREEIPLETVLQEAQRTVTSWGGRLYLVYIPSYGLLKNQGRETPPLRIPVLATARRLGIPAIDLYPVFQAHPAPLTLFPYPYAHFNEEGYRLAAEWILTALAAEQARERPE